MSIGAVSASSMQQAQKAEYLRKKEANNQHVYNHEMQHLRAAGQYAVGGIHIDYDQNGWATGGHVSVQMPVLDKNNPNKTIAHAKAIEASALAPSDPSDQDFKVYSAAQQVRFQAEQLLAKKQQNSNSQSTNKANS